MKSLIITTLLVVSIGVCSAQMSCKDTTWFDGCNTHTCKNCDCMVTYNEPKAPADQQPELRSILDQFQFQLKRYDEISTGITSVGHRFKDTNFPQAPGMDKPEKESSDGILYELRKCNERLAILNDKTEQTLSKLNGIL